MKKIILTMTTTLACLINFNGLFGAANNDQPESMEEFSRRYEAAQALQSLSSSSEPSSSNSTGLFDDAGPLKRIARSENKEKNQAKRSRIPQIIEARAESVAESNQRYIAEHREKFLQALAQANPENALDELAQLIYFQQNPDELVSTPEFNSFLHSNQLLEYVDQTVSNLISNPDNLHKLQTLYSFSAQNPELHDRLKHILQHLLLFVGRNNQPVIVDSDLAKSALGFIQGLYTVNLLHSPDEQNPLNAPQKVNLPDLSANSIKLLMQFIERTQIRDTINQSHSLDDTPEERAAKITRVTVLNGRITALLLDLTLQDLQELIHAATYLDLSQSLYRELLNLILRFIRGAFNNNFSLLNSFPIYMKKALATVSRRFNSNPPPEPIEPRGHGPAAYAAYQTALNAWQKNRRDFFQEARWRESALESSIFDLIAQNEVPAITVIDGRNILNLENRYIKSLEGLAAIPGIETVEELNLADNRLSFIPANAFSVMPNLRVLNLSHNLLSGNSSIKANALTGLNKLERLDLSRNTLNHTSIHINSFNHLRALKYLNMQDSLLGSVRQKQIREKIKQVTGHEPTIVW